MARVGDSTAAYDAVTAQELYAAGHLKWTMYGEGILGAFVAEMDFGTAPAVVAALHDAIDRRLFGYLPPALSDDLADACARWQEQTYGWKLDPNDVHPLPDVIRGLEVAIEHFSRPGSPVILPVPAYMPFLTVPSTLGRDTITVEMVPTDSRYVYDLDAVDRAYGDGGDLLILCNPHNPLGRVMERAEMQAISEVVARHGGRVFADEIHAPLVHPGHHHVPYASISTLTAGHTITATSASKAWNLPGLKCAEMLVSNDADRDRWEAIGRTASHGASTIGVVANIAAYREGREWLDGVLVYLDENRRALAGLLAEHLPEVRYQPPEGTYLAWLDCRALDVPTDLGDFFLEHANVALVNGTRCGELGRGFVRLNFGTPRPLLESMVKHMAAAVRPNGS